MPALSPAPKPKDYQFLRLETPRRVTPKRPAPPSGRFEASWMLQTLASSAHPMGYNAPMPHDATLTHTRPHSSTRGSAACDPPTSCLTILAHPDPTRIGEHFPLNPFRSNKSVPLSRLEPLFSPPRDEGAPRYLGDARLSRQPLLLSPLGTGAEDGVELDPNGASTLLTLNGERLERKRRIPHAEIAGGVALVLARRVALLLHHTELLTPSDHDHGLVGDSPAIVRLRVQIERAARHGDPVLLRGETGTGKELVARAIHHLSERRGKKHQKINLRAVPRELAGAELFGVARGAHSGADRKRPGHFQRADGSTLLLDELGEAAPEIQVALLRAIDNKEIQVLGGQEPQKVDVRVLAATDADLDAAIDEGTFRAPLLHRLATKIHLPPLRARRDDVGRLAVHFLRRELDAAGKGELLNPVGPDERPWLSAELLARLTRYDWPGNVRELENVVREIVDTSADRAEMSLSASSPCLRGSTAAIAEPRPVMPPATLPFATPPSADKASYRAPSEVTDAEFLDALRATEWSVRDATHRLNVSPTTAYRLRAKNPQVPQASALDRAQIEDAAERCEGNRDAMARLLQVSSRALSERMKKLGIQPGQESK